MSLSFKYKCDVCGLEHESWPSLANSSPHQYEGLSKEEKDLKAVLNEDFCVINHADQTDRFIRVVLNQKVTDHCEDLNYGLWVSLSEESFTDYGDQFKNEDHITTYSAWLCNKITGYDDTTAIPMTVQTRAGNKRPEVFPQKEHVHPFVKDYYEGITKAEAERRIKEMTDSVKQV